MTIVNRYDRVPLKAVRTDEGFLTDTPIISRVGIFEYQDGKGSIRRELRLPEHVFAADSLTSIKGKPVTNGHPGRVDARNVKHHAIGTVLSEGRADGEDLLTDIVIHDPAPVDAGRKELSCGYQCVLDETPGTWNGQRYDAIQTQIKYNHLAVVERGRAGNAKLNMDAADAVTLEEETMDMVKMRLDSGISYDAAPEVAQAYEALKTRADAAASKTEQEAARADTAEARVKELQDSLEQIKQDAQIAAKARIGLEAVAKEHKVEVKADSTDRQLREGVIKAVRGDSFDLTGKADAYVEAAFDLAVAEKSTRADAVAATRQAMNQDAGQSGTPTQSLSASASRAKYVAGIRH